MALLTRVGKIVAAATLAAGLAAPSAAGARESGERAYARGDYVRAARLLTIEAERGEPAAQTYLGSMYSVGLGVPRDYARAVYWLRAAAEQGVPTAQFLLGLAYDKGHGVPQDFVTAEALLDRAAAHADARRRDHWTRIRDAVASKLTRDELAEAQRRATDGPLVVETR